MTDLIVGGKDGRSHFEDPLLQRMREPTQDSATSGDSFDETFENRAEPSSD
jgi:hypothetical protein